MEDLYSLVDWSRAQFALTAMFHWLFVPLTLGLGLIVCCMETIYYRTRDELWKRITKFWMNLYGVNFALGVATGIILEFQFGTNWSNYSWFVGDIFGAPLAIEGIMAFFMESTFIAVMFFGWNKVSRGAHLAATWLTTIGASVSALWILVANAWMQYPAGMMFNPDTVRNEMVDFFAVLLSPVAINKFFHSVTAGWVMGAAFVVAVSAWFLLKKRETLLAEKSMRIAAWVGFAGIVLVSYTGDGSACQVAEKQPMKLAAMEGIYQGSYGQGFVAFGILNPAKKSYNDGADPFLFKIEIPRMLSLLATHDTDGYVAGIEDILAGGYPLRNADSEWTTALSAEERIAEGREAIQALADYRAASEAGDVEAAVDAAYRLERYYPNFGYGYVTDLEQLVPHVPLVFYSFHLMIMLGGYFLLLFIVVLIFSYKKMLARYTWLLWVFMLSLPLAYICLQTGWIVAEVGRQPWVIQDIMPTFAAISRIGTSAVQTTFWLFALLFTLLLGAEIGIMLKQIKKGSEQK